MPFQQKTIWKHKHLCILFVMNMQIYGTQCFIGENLAIIHNTPSELAKKAPNWRLPFDCLFLVAINFVVQSSYWRSDHLVFAESCHPSACHSGFCPSDLKSWSHGHDRNNLVGGWTTPLKNMLVKMDHFPNFRGENKKYLSCHHLATAIELGFWWALL